MTILWPIVLIRLCCIFLLVYSKICLHMRLVSIYVRVFVLDKRLTLFYYHRFLFCSPCLCQSVLWDVSYLFFDVVKCDCVFFFPIFFCAFVLFIDNSGLSGSENFASPDVNFFRWLMHPMNDLSCFRVSGISGFFLIHTYFRWCYASWCYLVNQPS